jgi:hypothetical protein
MWVKDRDFVQKIAKIFSFVSRPVNTIRKHFLLLGVLCLAAGRCVGSSYVIDWTYEYGVGAPGTKSESVYGRLLYKGDELPKEFEHVITPIGEFVFVDGRGFGSDNTVAWVPYGKLGGNTEATARLAMRESEVQELLTGNEPIFRRVILSHAGAGTEAYIAGAFEKPPAGAGKDWFYAVGKNLWVNPRETAEVLKEKFGTKR